MMRPLVGLFTTLALALAAGAPAAAQTGERVLDVLTDLLRGDRPLRGHVVAVHDADVIVAGADGRTYVVGTAGVEQRQLGALEPGRPVRITLREGGGGQALVAAAIAAERAPRREFRTVSGSVEAVEGDQIRFRTRDGFVVRLAADQIVGRRPTLRPGEPATLTYEQRPDAIVGVWIDPGAAPAASPRPGEPAAPGGFQRVQGFVESVGIGTLTMKTDDGRVLTVDLREARGAVTDVRPGDLVSVVGRPVGDRVVAELVQRDRR